MKHKTSKTHIREVLAYFVPQVWRQFKGYFFICGTSTILTIAAPFVSILMLPMIIDELCGERRLEVLLLYAAVLIISERVLTAAVNSLSIQTEKYSERFNNYFTEQLSERIMKLRFQLTEDKNALDQLQLAREGMGWYSGGAAGIIQPFFNIIIHAAIIAGVVALIIANAPLLLPITALTVAVSFFANSKINTIEIEQYTALSKLNRIFSYLGQEIRDFRYGKDIRLYSAQNMMLEKWDEYTEESSNNLFSGAKRQLPFQLLKIPASVLRNFLCYLILGILVIAGKMTLGIFSQMLSSSAKFNESMEALIQQIQELVKRTNYAYEYVKFMNYPEAISTGTRNVERCAHTIEFKNVCFTYPKTSVNVLNGVNITLKQGEHLSVVGLNGAGKTTFIKLLCRLYDPTEGEILLDGVNIKEYDIDEYMGIIAPVFQDFKLFAFSIRDNIGVLDNISDNELEPLIEKVGLAEMIDSLEKGADTNLFKPFDENGIEPSGGEQQKLAIARALYKNAPLVVLDEPTAALDPLAEYEIYCQFNELVGERTAIYISHRLSSCKFCDKIAVFSDGVIAEYGTHDELVEKSGGIYAKMFAAQAKYYKDIPEKAL